MKMAELGDPILEPRFWAKVQADPGTGCWLWTAVKSPEGYGRYWYQRQQWLAHRASYDALVGSIPTDYEVDHLCQNPPCVNPAHLEAVSRQEHSRRSRRFDLGKWHLSKTHCPHGHPYDTENTYVRKTGQRECRECRRARRRRY